MENARLGPVAVAAALLFCRIDLAHSAPITWEPVTNETGNVSDIFDYGTLVESATAGATEIVNGVTFEGQSSFSDGVLTFGGGSQITVSGIAVGYAQYGMTDPTWNASYQGLVSGGAYAHASMPSGTQITLGGLTIGQGYYVQVLEAVWNNNWATTFTNGNSAQLNLSGADENQGASLVPQYVDGYFVADATSETIDLSSSTMYVIFDAIQVRVPEPLSAALLIVGMTAVGVVSRRRRRPFSEITAAAPRTS
jgi:hypothetical protein